MDSSIIPSKIYNYVHHICFAYQYGSPRSLLLKIISDKVKKLARRQGKIAVLRPINLVAPLASRGLDSQQFNASLFAALTAEQSYTESGADEADDSRGFVYLADESRRYASLPKESAVYFLHSVAFLVPDKRIIAYLAETDRTAIGEAVIAGNGEINIFLEHGRRA